LTRAEAPAAARASLVARPLASRKHPVRESDLTMRLLTTTEAAEYLRLKERKIYELVSEGAIPCTKITGKRLFPKDELDRWLADSLQRPPGMRRQAPMPIVGGSHDPLLEWALRESGSGLATLAEGSEAGLARFMRGELVAAAIHLHALASETADANVAAMRSERGLYDAVLLAFARREQGFLTAPGNPLGIGGLNDVLEKRARVAVRPQGAGAQLLLQALLHRAKSSLDRMKVAGPPCPTGPDVAQAIRAGRADCGIATRSAANAAGLDFVPIVWERFDLVVRQRDYFRKPMQALLEFLRSPAIAARARELGGYDLADAGKARFTE
jgi:putative molybdopterin biosynthesis protein